MNVTIAQQVVTRHIHTNLGKVLTALDRASPGDWVVFPEGNVSGYAPEDPEFTRTLDEESIERAIHAVVDKGRDRGCHSLFGSVTRAGEVWRNSVVIASGGSAITRLSFPGLIGTISRRERSPLSPRSSKCVSALSLAGNCSSRARGAR